MSCHRPLVAAAVSLLLPALATAQTVQRIDITGATVLSAARLRETIQSALQGKPARPDVLRSALDAVVALYKREGYSLAQVTDYRLEPDGTLAVTLSEGRVRQIEIQGNRKTRTALLRHAMTLQPGMVYREATVQADRNRLARLGLFQDILISPRLPGEGNELGQVDLLVRVKEASSGTVAATVGYSDVTGLVGFVDVAENNVGGMAQRVAFQWQRFGRIITLEDGSLAEDRPRTAFDLTYQRPAVAAKDLILGASVYDQNTIFLPTFGGSIETIRSYERRKGGSVRLGRATGGLWTLGMSARHDEVGYDAVPDYLDPPTAELSRAAATVGAIGLTAQADNRDRADNPRQGFLYRLTHEEAGAFLGGNRRFRQSVADLRRYAPLPLPRKPGAAVAARLMGGFSSGDIPLSEQFFLGGFDLLRGYDFFSIRGDRMVLGSAEARVPLGQDTAGVVFVDAGGAWRRGENLSGKGIKVGAGVGLRFQSPIGPLRLDIAYGDQVRTYVSLGQSF